MGVFNVFMQDGICVLQNGDPFSMLGFLR